MFAAREQIFQQVSLRFGRVHTSAASYWSVALPAPSGTALLVRWIDRSEKLVLCDGRRLAP